jgi:hypothetical protein
MSDNCGLPLYVEWGAPESDKLACKPHMRGGEEGVEAEPTVFRNFWSNWTMKFIDHAEISDTSILTKRAISVVKKTHT